MSVEEEIEGGSKVPTDSAAQYSCTCIFDYKNCLLIESPQTIPCEEVLG